jgi:hypothetical protein
MTRKTTRATRMKKRRSSPLTLRGGVCLALIAAVLCLPVLPAAALGGPRGAGTAVKVPKLRTIDGTVRDKGGEPIQGAVVYLQDSRSLAVKSYLSDEAGQFHFRQLSLSADYSLWAEVHGNRSKAKSISQFNSKPDLHFTLKVHTEQK